MILKMNNYSLEGLNITAADFLRPFFAPNETVCLRVFSDKPDSAFSGQKLECEMAHFEEMEHTLKAHNEQNRGVYFVINYGGHEDSQISRINAQFMECDDIPLEEQLAKIQAFPLEPSLIVKTRKSLHCYWLIKHGDVSAFRRVQRKLISYFGADTSCVNESRVFRLPGFHHHKKEPVLVQVIKYNPFAYLLGTIPAQASDRADQPIEDLCFDFPRPVIPAARGFVHLDMVYQIHQQFPRQIADVIVLFYQFAE